LLRVARARVLAHINDPDGVEIGPTDGDDDGGNADINADVAL
jgi:hypothetical protein